jgi:hypothetical protein
MHSTNPGLDQTVRKAPVSGAELTTLGWNYQLTPNQMGSVIPADAGIHLMPLSLGFLWSVIPAQAGIHPLYLSVLAYGMLMDGPMACRLARMTFAS